MPARFVLRESYDAQNAAGGSVNVYGDGRSCRYKCSVTPRDDVILSPQTVKGENGNLG